MTRPPGPAAKPAARRMRGFEAASLIVGERIRSAAEKRGFAVARILTHWAEIAGPGLSEVTRPLKVSFPRDGFGATLSLLVSSAHAPVVQMQLPALRERVNACYGYSAIARITLTQTAPTGFAEGQTPFAPAPRRAVPAPDPATEARVALAASQTAAGIGDDKLRAALELLARNILRKSRTT
jgi:hypothetical protein